MTRYFTADQRPFLERECAFGSPAECIASLKSFVDAGATMITLRLRGDDHKRQFKRVTEQVLPGLM